MKKQIEPCYYGDYLKLDELLNAQIPVSGEYGEEAHEETLFIIVHQVYELWFKQIIHELNSIIISFDQPSLSHNELALCVHRLERIVTIQKLMNQQIDVMETMTPKEFLEFRNYLVPASGFQSIQFKVLEISLGLKSDFRIDFDKQSFYSRLNKAHQDLLLQLETKPSLFELVNKWLSRMPFLELNDFKFWEHYEKATSEMLNEEVDIISSNSFLSEKERAFQLKEHERTKQSFSALFDEKEYARLLDVGDIRLNQKAMLSAIFISLYRDEPVFSIPYKFISCLTDVDENLTIWRYKHMMMVQRMIGRKIGTGGSSGHDYLRKTTENNRIFSDFFNLSTFLISKNACPPLPSSIIQEMSFKKKY